MFIGQLQTDYIINGHSSASSFRGLEQVRFDPDLRRPFLVNHNGRDIPCVTINTGRTVYDHKAGKEVAERKTFPVAALEARGLRSPVFNATALRKEEWIQLDLQVLRAARYRLRAWADLAAVNSFGGFNGMSKMILEHEVMSDPGEAIVDMSPLAVGRNDPPRYQLRGLPLPVTHVDFAFDARQLAVSRNTGTPLDTVKGESAGRRVAEAIEKTTIGNQTGPVYGGASTYAGGYDITSQVYGYLTYPNRIAKTGYYIPTGNGSSGTGWVPADTVNNVLNALNSLKAHKFYGPFMVYHSNDWDPYLDKDYILTGGNVATQTLRERLRAIEGISDVRRLDFLFASLTDQSSGGPGLESLAAAYPFTMIIVQLTPDVARAVNGMDITTLQWSEVGGMKLCFKCLAIQVPQIRSDFYGNCGILTASFNA